jgi:hypothetical protein
LSSLTFSALSSSCSAVSISVEARLQSAFESQTALAKTLKE